MQTDANRWNRKVVVVDAAPPKPNDYGSDQRLMSKIDSFVDKLLQDDDNVSSSTIEQLIPMLNDWRRKFGDRQDPSAKWSTARVIIDQFKHTRAIQKCALPQGHMVVVEEVHFKRQKLPEKNEIDMALNESCTLLNALHAWGY